MSPVGANERGSFVEFFYRATGRNQHLGKACSFASMIRANEGGCFFSVLPQEVPLFWFPVAVVGRGWHMTLYCQQGGRMEKAQRC